MMSLSIGTISAAIMLLLLIGFLAGYLTGKKQGRLIGSSETLAEIPLIIRQKSLDRGQCLICSQFLDFYSHSYIEQLNEEKAQD